MITVLAGTNSFALRQKRDEMVRSFIDEHGDLALDRVDGEEADFDRINEALHSLPFLAARKLVVLDQPGLNREFAEGVGEVFADLPEITDVLVVEPKPDKRTAYYKWLKKNTDFHELVELDERGLAKWAVAYAKGQGASLMPPDAQYLVGRVGLNQQRLAHELDKLLLHGDITRETIDALTDVSPHSKIFDLLDAAFNGRAERAIELYQEQRTMRVEPQEILAMVGWQLRQVALAKTATGHDLVREGKVSPYGARKAQAIASRLTLVRLKQLVHDLVVLDARSKRQPLDLDEALQNYILNLA